MLLLLRPSRRSRRPEGSLLRGRRSGGGDRHRLARRVECRDLGGTRDDGHLDGDGFRPVSKKERTCFTRYLVMIYFQGVTLTWRAFLTKV